MCGLIVAWDAGGLRAAPLAAALYDIRHRGPDRQATVFLEGQRLYLAHARLKIIDISDSANQPMHSPCGRYTLVYNGEIYNYRQIRRELSDFWKWRTQSDTEVLLAAWARWGLDCLPRLAGMFAFAVHDAERKCVTLVRDRFGIKPLYYYASDNRWAFASEISPLLRFMGSAGANESTIRTYLESGLYNHSRYTFFQGVFAVEPGTLIDIDLRNDEWQEKRWYYLTEHIPDLSAATREEIQIEAGKRVDEAIKSHLVADVNVGLNVSGGVDSSMLVRVAIEALGRVHLFTQDYEGYSELPWVRDVSAGGVLHVATLGPREIEGWLLPTVRSQAEPFGGISVCGYNALYRLAAQNNITVLLDGNGVDEIFLGYKRYHQLYVYSAPTEPLQKKRANEFAQFWGTAPDRPAAGRAIDGTSGLRPQTISNRLSNVAPLPSLEVPGFADPVRHAAAEDLLYAKIPRGLRFNDLVSMAHSRELRVPYLDHRLVEYAFGIPTEMLLGDRGTKIIFRELLARKANKSVAYAVKRSVQSPQREWLATDWRPLVESLLKSDSFRDRDWVDPQQMEASYEAYLDGENENSFFIWQWINLELWAREFLDGGNRS